MSTPSNATTQSLIDAPSAVPAPMRATQPFYWSVRRELWEYRAVYIAPLAAAGVVLFGFLLGTAHIHNARVAVAGLDPMKRQILAFVPYAASALSILATALIVAVFYCLGAPHNERRDRSILFWKSLPVSDVTTVLSKASIPLVVLPLIVLAVVVATQIVMLAVSAAVLAANGLGTAALQVPMFKVATVELYAVFVLALWYAPIYGWLFLVSAWARRMAFLWAVLPPLALCIVEHLAFDTSYLFRLLGYRLGGVVDIAFKDLPNGKSAIDPWALLDPVGFFTSAGLWLGLGAAAAFLAGAIWLRRYREPI